MLAWFVVLGVIGLAHILQQHNDHVSVLRALNRCTRWSSSRRSA
jgi:K+ transporter